MCHLWVFIQATTIHVLLRCITTTASIARESTTTAVPQSTIATIATTITMARASLMVTMASSLTESPVVLIMVVTMEFLEEDTEVAQVVVIAMRQVVDRKHYSPMRRGVRRLTPLFCRFTTG